jgi:hypothetical protein
MSWIPDSNRDTWSHRHGKGNPLQGLFENFVSKITVLWDVMLSSLVAMHAVTFRTIANFMGSAVIVSTFLIHNNRNINAVNLLMAYFTTLSVVQAIRCEIILWDVNRLLGNVMLNELPWRQTLDKQPDAKLRKNRTRLCSPLLGNGSVNRHSRRRNGVTQ